MAPSIESTFSVNDRLLKLLREVSTAIHSQMEDLPAVKALGLPPFPSRLLDVIGRHPGISQFEIAAGTGRDRAQVARAVGELERRGLVAKEARDSNWRAHCLRLTQEGLRVHEPILAQASSLKADALATLGVEEKKLVCVALEKIMAALDSKKSSM